jgi:hypothetical protein
MKPFKSFDEFINENYTTGSFGRLNEETSTLGVDYKFDFDKENPGANEAAKFFMKAKYRVVDNDSAEVAAEKMAKYVTRELLGKPEFVAALNAGDSIPVLAVSRDVYKQGMDRVVLKGYITFMKTTSDQGVPIITPEILATLPGFKPLEVGPELTVKGVKIYDAELIKKVVKGEYTPPKPPEPEPITPSTSGESATTTTTAPPTGDTSLSWDWLKDALSMPSQVLEFLKSKLLANDAAKAKRGSKNRETKFVQLIVQEPAFSKEKYPASSEVKNKLGAADGQYGPNTSNAFAMFFDSKRDSVHDEVGATDVENLAKFCTKLDILVPKTNSSVGLEELWNRSQLGGGGGGKDDGEKKKTDDVTPGATDFIYINKPGAQGVIPPTPNPSPAPNPAPGPIPNLVNPADQNMYAADSTKLNTK